MKYWAALGALALAGWSLPGCANQSSVTEVQEIPVITFEGGTYCAAYQRRLVACDVLGEGLFQGCHEFGDVAESCELDCLTQAPCDEVATYLCGHFGAELSQLDACMQGCVGLPAVECADGRLLSRSTRCDGVVDCQDEADEAECEGDTLIAYGSCRDGAFFTRAERCDGKPNCANEADEVACDTLVVCVPADQRQSFVELPALSACDGVKDCLGGEDEPAECAVASCSR